MLRNILSRVNAGLGGQSRSCSTATAHPLLVKQEIDKRRAAALLGGGQKRIDAQHKKVSL